jgi:hypothetical protein
MSGGIAPPFFPSALDGDGWSALHTGEEPPAIHWIGSWVVSKAGLDAVEKRKISCHCLESNPGRPARSLSLFQLSYLGSKIKNILKISFHPE